MQNAHQKLSAKFLMGRTLFYISSLILNIQIAAAQLPTPELSEIFPPMAKPGDTLTVTLEGTNLEGLRGLHFTIPGVEAKPVFAQQSAWRKNQYRNGTEMSVTIPKDASGGLCEVRAISHYGISNPRVFQILPADASIIEKEGGHEMESASPFVIGQYVAGRFDADQTDFYRISLKKNQRIFVECQSEKIDSRGDSTLVLMDSKGTILDNNRDAHFRDAFLDFTAPVDGAFFVGVHDFLYRKGGPYLLRIHSAPHIDAIFPPAGKAGATSKFTLFGRNLPGGSLSENLSIDGKPLESLEVSVSIPQSGLPDSGFHTPVNGLAERFLYQVKGSNHFPILVTDLPTVHQLSSNDPIQLTLPASVSSFFRKENEEHRYRFRGVKGKSYTLSIQGDAIQGQIDPHLVLEKITKDKDGKETLQLVKELDDSSSGHRPTFPNRSRDPRLTFTANADTDYQVTVLDQFRSSGVASIYRCTITETLPDFSIIASIEKNRSDGKQIRPGSLSLRQDGSYLMKLVAIREGGFDGQIAIVAEDLPAGVSLADSKIPKGKDSTYAVLFAATDAKTWAGKIQLKGRAEIDGHTVERDVFSASAVNTSSDISKARLRTRLEAATALAVTDVEKSPAILRAKATDPLKVEIGSKLELPFSLSANKSLKGNLTVDVIGLDGLKKSPTVALAADKKEGKLTINFQSTNNFKPSVGTYSFVLRGLGVFGKYRHYPQRAAKLSEDLKILEEKIKDLGKDDTDGNKAAEEEKKRLNEELKRANAMAKEKDALFAVYSQPIFVEVTPAPVKK